MITISESKYRQKTLEEYYKEKIFELQKENDRLHHLLWKEKVRKLPPDEREIIIRRYVEQCRSLRKIRNIIFHKKRIAVYGQKGETQ